MKSENIIDQGEIMSASHWIKMLIILLFAVSVRFWGTFDFPSYDVDEWIYIPSVISLAQHGTPTNSNWIYPPFGTLMVWGSMKLFGNNPHGWRMMGVFFGAASIIPVYLIGLRLYPRGWVSLIAASILALDPFHAYYSRTIFMEIPAIFFFLCYLYLMLEYAFRPRPLLLLLAGAALGLTFATKGAYFLVNAFLVAGYALYRTCREGSKLRAQAIDFSLALVFLPVIVYLFSYAVWFGRGYAFSEFLQMRSDALWFLGGMTEASFPNADILAMGGRPWEWFLKPIINGFQTAAEGDSGRYLLAINNPPVRLLTIPAVIFTVIHARRSRDIDEMLPSMLFCGGYLLFLLVSRPFFSYSAIVLLPFAYLAVARSFELVARQLNREKPVYASLMVGLVAWGFYTFPLYSAQLVPVALYWPILRLARLAALQ